MYLCSQAAKVLKPTVRVVELRHRTSLLAGSLLDRTSTNLGSDDDIIIEDTPIGDGSWGR